MPRRQIFTIKIDRYKRKQQSNARKSHWEIFPKGKGIRTWVTRVEDSRASNLPNFVLIHFNLVPFISRTVWLEEWSKYLQWSTFLEFHF